MPDASMPDASMPDASMPDASMPDASMPDASMPDASMPDGSTAVSVAVVPQSVRTRPGGTLHFTAMVTGTSNTAVTWSVMEGASGGSIAASGAYTAPSEEGSYHVLATSNAEPSAVGTATVTVAMTQACTDLPPAGTWEDITPTRARGIDGTVLNAQAFALDPFDPQTVWLGTAPTHSGDPEERSGLYKSTDCGATWTLVSTGANAADIERSSLWSMAVDPVAQGTMYVVGAYGALGLFKSTNGGVDWEQLFPEGSQHAQLVEANFVGAVIMDPTDNNHLVITGHGRCEPPAGRNDSSCQGETFDGGATWTLVPNPDDLGFQENAGAMILGMNNWLYSDPFRSTYRTTDHGATWTEVGPGAQGAQSAHRPIVPAPDGNYYLPSDSGVLISRDQGASWEVIPNTPSGYGFAIGAGRLFICPQFSLDYKAALIENLDDWTTLPNPPVRAEFRGSAFMDYDEVHNILYTSNYEGGLFRMVYP